MKFARVCLMGSLLIPFAAFATDFEVVGVTGNGEIVWDDTNTNGTYTVQWSPSLETPHWSSDWSSLTQIAATGGVLSARIPMFFRILHRPRQSPASEMMLVSGGGQPQGPQYDFYMSKYEVRNEEYCEFLNDAEANTTNERGQYLYFSESGDVYLDTNTLTMMVFKIEASRLLYNINSNVGSRYTVHNDYIGHPITGVSWYGSMKYCNWLTLREGRGISQRCYSEGPLQADWHPINITYAEYSDGFSDVERLEWVQGYSGFRLPMDDDSGGANYFNEYYKAAAWTGSSNSLYAFGRNSIDGRDSNYSSSGDPYQGYAIATTPVGYYDDSDHGGLFQTRSNANIWGIYDLSGNVYEWMTEKYYRGGGWTSGSAYCLTSARTEGVAQHATSGVGFRVVSTSP